MADGKSLTVTIGVEDRASEALRRTGEIASEMAGSVPTPDPAAVLAGVVDHQIRREAIRHLPGALAVARDFEEQMARIGEVLRDGHP